jgi:hypothetical protein
MDPTEEDYEGEGVDSTLAKRRNSDSETSSLSSVSTNYSADSALEDDEAVRKAVLDKEKDRNWVEKKIHKATPTGVKNALLRKTVK